jgi:hypothetical protein
MESLTAGVRIASCIRSLAIDVIGNVMILLPPATLPLYALGPALNVLNGANRWEPFDGTHGGVLERLELAQANCFILVTEWRTEQPPSNRRNGRAKVRFANATLFVSFLPTINGNLVIRGEQTD